MRKYEESSNIGSRRDVVRVVEVLNCVVVNSFLNLMRNTGRAFIDECGCCRQTQMISVLLL